MKAAILEFRRAAPARAAPSHVRLDGAATDLVYLFGLDRIPAGRRRLACHWHPGPNGRLVAVWEPAVASVPHR
jgi:hypothetical protein